MTQKQMPRPGTLAEAILRYSEGTQEFDLAAAEFLDEFYWDSDTSSRMARILDCPVVLGDTVLDAYVGAVGEHLARRWRLGSPPEWTEDSFRFLREPWFPPGVNLGKAMLIKESPLAFRRRFLFVEAEPLRRATMPRDQRWLELESIRTGLPIEALRDDEPVQRMR